MNIKESAKIWQDLWSKLVPKKGQADTVQGDLVRVIGRMTHELVSNGYSNWDDGYEIMCNFLEKTLEDGTFDSVISRRISIEIGHIKTYGRGQKVSQDVESAHDFLMIKVVEWCSKHPKLIPRAIDTNLKR